MYKWYQKALVCYAYLSDVDRSDINTFERSKWFFRGWTLQELLAPCNVLFFDAAWSFIGSKDTLLYNIHSITRIPPLAVTRFQFPSPGMCCAEVMSWAAKRETTRIEDLAYCLLGLFDINMPLLYGEGDKAFRRLQEAILTKTGDISLLIWTGLHHVDTSNVLLAPSPVSFEPATWAGHDFYFSHSQHVSLAHRGVSIECRLVPIYTDIYLADVASWGRSNQGFSGIFLRQGAEEDLFDRVIWNNDEIFSRIEPRSIHSFEQHDTIRKFCINWKGTSTMACLEDSFPEITFGHTDHALEIYGHDHNVHEAPRDTVHLYCQHPKKPGIFQKHDIQNGTASIYAALDHNLALTCIIADHKNLHEIPGFECPSSNVLEECLYQTTPSLLASRSLSTYEILAQLDRSLSYFPKAIVSFRQTFRRYIGRDKNDCKILIQLGHERGALLLISIKLLAGPFRNESLWLEVAEFAGIEDYPSFVQGQEMKRKETLVRSELEIFRKQIRSTATMNYGPNSISAPLKRSNLHIQNQPKQRSAA